MVSESTRNGMSSTTTSTTECPPEDQPCSLSVGVWTRTLAVLPVDEARRFTLRFALPPADALGWPFRLEPQAAYMLEYQDSHMGGILQMPLCGWASVL